MELSRDLCEILPCLMRECRWQIVVIKWNGFSWNFASYHSTYVFK